MQNKQDLLFNFGTRGPFILCVDNEVIILVIILFFNLKYEN